MKMVSGVSNIVRHKIGVWSSDKDLSAGVLVKAALIRSFSKAQVDEVNTCVDIQAPTDGMVLINPDYEMFLAFSNMIKLKKMKIVVLGSLDSVWANFLGVTVSPVPDEWVYGDSVIDRESIYKHSPWRIDYRLHELNSKIPYAKRYLSRFDFTDEWNNLGYGRIWTRKNASFAVATKATCGADSIELAWIADEEDRKITSFSVLREEKDSSVLWINREVGTIDSLEWSAVESFFSDYRSEALPCFPRLMEIPSGTSGLCTMRLDCDQAIASARPVFELYQREGIPFSLAILTGLSMSVDDRRLINDVIDSGGGILSHSVNHLPDWGGCYETAFREAIESKQWLEGNDLLQKRHYVVSPFHQNPAYAVKAMVDAGYAGFVGGIIHNDPEYMFARAGVVPLQEEADFFSLSQQCMLHGDCFHQYGNSMEPYIEAFENQMAGESIFGYLDHPFSSEYQYGWINEDERVGAHKKLIQHMKQRKDIQFCNLVEAMEFCRQRSQTQVWVDDDEQLMNSFPEADVDNELVNAIWKNIKYVLR